MKKKIFGVGVHNGIEFTKEKILEFFHNLKTLPVIFDHTSVYKKDNLNPPEIGQCSIELSENGDVYGTFEFNQDGTTYEKNKSFKGISCELSLLTGLAEKVSLLPRRTKQAVAGAEFDEKEKIYSEVIEFEEIEEGGTEMTLEEIVNFLKTAGIGDKIEIMSSIVGSLSEADTRAARALAFEFAAKTYENEEDIKKLADEKGLIVEFSAKPEPESYEKMKERVRKEVENENKAKVELMEFENKIKTKLLPADQEVFRMAFKAAQGNNETLEFEEGKEKITAMEYLNNLIDSREENPLLQEFAAHGSTKLTDEQKALKELEEAKKRAEGGK